MEIYPESFNKDDIMGSCPNCDSTELDYDGEKSDEGYVYHVTCEECHFRWDEWYDLIFSENIIR